MTINRKVHSFIDGRGTPILDRCSMMKLYSGCERSTNILNGFLPNEWAVSPGIGIIFEGRNAKHVELILWTPKSTVTDYFIMSEKRLEAFRNLWKNEKGLWKKSRLGDFFYFYRSSFLYLLPTPGEPMRCNHRWAVL